MGKKKKLTLIIVYLAGFVTNYVIWQGEIYAALLGFGIGMIIGVLLLITVIAKSLDVAKRVMPPKLF